MAVLAVVGLMLAPSAFADSYGWSGSPWDVTAGAFNVSFDVYNGGNPIGGWYYYEWKVTLNDATHWAMDPGVYPVATNPSGPPTGYDPSSAGQIKDYMAFEFQLPTEEKIINGGGPDGWSFDTWQFQPSNSNKLSTHGAWNGNNNTALGPGVQGDFIAGFWTQDAFPQYDANGDPVDYPVQIHVRTSSPSTWTGRIQLDTVEVGVTNDLPPAQAPTVTPELPIWALLACTALFGVGYLKKRKT